MKSSQLLKTLRELAGLTQQKVVDGIISESYYSKIECDIHQINATTFFKILNKNYLSFSLLEGLVDGVFNNDYMDKVQKDFSTEKLEELYEKIKSQKENLSTAHYISLLIYLYTYHSDLVPKIIIEDRKLLEKKKKKILNNDFNINLMRQAITFHGLLGEKEFLDVMRKSRLYVTKNPNKYTVETYLGVAERFVSNVFVNRIEATDEIKEELERIQVLIKKLLPNDYSLAFKKISITLGINTVLKTKNSEHDNALLRNTLMLAKPNLTWIERNENENEESK